MKTIYHHVTNTTNIETVSEFFKKMSKKVELYNKVIVMDNHAAHHSKVVEAFIKKHKGLTLFMPPISSYFNPIETVWSWLKGKWRNELIKLQGA